MVFFNTDWQTYGHTNSIQNESPHYPIQVRAQIFLYPIFLPLSKRSELATALFKADVGKYSLDVPNSTSFCHIQNNVIKICRYENEYSPAIVVPDQSSILPRCR